MNLLKNLFLILFKFFYFLLRLSRLANSPGRKSLTADWISLAEWLVVVASFVGECILNEFADACQATIPTQFSSKILEID